MWNVQRLEWIPHGESIYLVKTDTEIWRYSKQIGLDTLVVYTANDEYYELGKFTQLPKLTR